MPTRRDRPRSSRHAARGASGDQRQTLIVGIFFVGVIAVSVLLLGAAVAASWYGDHLRSVADVNGSSITIEQFRNRVAVLDMGINVAERRMRDAIALGEVTADQGQSALSSLEQSRQNEPSTALNGLIQEDLVRQFAGSLGVSVTGADLDAALARAAITPGSRHVFAMSFAPAPDPTSGLPTDATRAAAAKLAASAQTDLAGGQAWASVAQTAGPTSSRDLGFVVSDETTDDPVLLAAAFALTGNGTTEVVTGQDGAYWIAQVTEIHPDRPDAQFTADLATVDAGAYRASVEARLLQQKVTDTLVSRALAGPVDQVRVSEILMASKDSTSASPATTGEIRVSHILYSPNGDAQAATSLASDDPGWAAAQAKAQAAADSLRAITDVSARETAFAALAKTDSNDTASGANGGDLGFAAASSYVPEFAAAISESGHVKGDIIGPVRSAYGYHVILWEAEHGAAATRIADVAKAAGVAGADFAALAKAQSEGAEAAAGGDLGWFARGQSSDYRIEAAIFALSAGDVGAPLLLDDGYHLYKVTERASRPVSGDQVAAIRANAFADWYAPQAKALQDAGKVTVDPSFTGQ